MANGNVYSVQHNLNVGGDLINVNGATAEEVKDHMIALAEVSDELFEAVITVKQAALAKGVFSERSNNGGSQSTAKPVQTTAVSSNPDGTKSCKHGELKRLDYTKSNGEEVHGYYCQAKWTGKGSKCDPIKDGA